MNGEKKTRLSVKCPKNLMNNISFSLHLGFRGKKRVAKKNVLGPNYNDIVFIILCFEKMEFLARDVHGLFS